MMKQYIGTKIIHAEPEEGIEQIGDNMQGSPGYKVMYEDGYFSWSPKDVFEKAYRETSGVSFGLMLEAVKMGRGARLPYWSQDVFIGSIQPGENNQMTAPYFYVGSRFGEVPWIPNMIELFSDDWVIFQYS